MSKQSVIVSMPEEIELHNAAHERCDILIGPCSCGAWHTTDNLEKIIALVKERQDEINNSWR